MKNETRYIVVVFYEGIGRTLQTDDKVRIFFSRYAKVYKNLGSAICKANKLFYQYKNEKTCVFKVSLNEELSCDRYKDWYKDKDRLVWTSEQWLIG